VSDSHAEHRARAARASGDWPLLALFARDEVRTGIEALLALRVELDDILDGDHAPDLALPRLEWWRAELARSVRGAPAHPLSRAIAKTITLTPADGQLLEDLVDGALDHLEGPRAADEDAWVLWRQRRGGALLALLLRVAGEPLAEREQFRLGGCIAELEALGTLGRGFALGRVCLGPDAPDPAAFKAGAPAALEHVNKRLHALRADLAVLRNTLRSEAASTPTTWVALALAERRCAELSREPLRGLKHAPHTGPATVFRAWRAAAFRS
jgi:phytoene/squalene synthetase